jgi:hypothetical protein
MSYKLTTEFTPETNEALFFFDEASFVAGVNFSRTVFPDVVKKWSEDERFLSEKIWLRAPLNNSYNRIPRLSCCCVAASKSLPNFCKRGYFTILS